MYPTVVGFMSSLAVIWGKSLPRVRFEFAPWCALKIAGKSLGLRPTASAAGAREAETLT